MTEFKWEELNRRSNTVRRREPSQDALRLARQVKEVLPNVPIRDILKDLGEFTAAKNHIKIESKNYIFYLNLHFVGVNLINRNYPTRT